MLCREPGAASEASQEPMTSHRSPKHARTPTPRRFLGAFLVPLFIAGACGANAAVTTKAIGSLNGDLIMEGGATGNSGPRPIRGTIEISLGGRRVTSLKVGTNGRFSVALPDGSYRIDARTPMIETASPAGLVEADCAPPAPAQVTAGATTEVTVICPVP